MIIECVGAPFTYRWPTWEVRLIQGRPVELPKGRVSRLLEKVPERFAVVESTNRTEMRATVLEDLGHGVWVFHPMTQVECMIPRMWLKESS